MTARMTRIPAALLLFLALSLSASAGTPPRPAATASAVQSASAFPSQLTPPSEDLAQVDDSDDLSADDRPFQFPMILNDSVENQIEYFKTRGRKVFQRWLDRSAKLIPVMRDIFRKKNLPDDLVYVAMIESGFNPYAVSWARAVGPWQFMPGTARLYGLKINWWVDERKDPIKSTYAAADHLKDLYNLFGSWPLALASYNAGAGKVQRAVLRSRSEDFWDLNASRFIRRETKNYVPKFMAAVIIARDPESYGFTPSDSSPLQYDEVVIHQCTDLRLIARCAGCTYEQVKELNPELRRWVTPPHDDHFVLRIPAGTKEVFEKNFAAVPADQKITWDRYQVKRGETLADIAEHYNTTASAIKDANGLRRNRILPGRHLLIPVDLKETSDDVAYLTPERSKREQTIFYRVRRGDSLIRIARRHNVSIADIREWNRGLGRTLRIGQKIRLIVNVDQI